MFHTQRPSSSAIPSQNASAEDQKDFINSLYARNVHTLRKKDAPQQVRTPKSSGDSNIPLIPISPTQGSTSMQSQVSVPPSQTSHPIRNALITVCITCIVIGLAGIGYLYVSQDQQSITSTVEGVDPTKTPEEIVQGLNEKVPEGMMNIQIAPIFTTDENLTGDINMANSQQNHFDQKLVLKDSTNDVLFESQFISPGQELHDIQLRNPPDESTSLLIAEITGYDRTTHDVAGTMSVEIRYVQKGAQK